MSDPRSTQEKVNDAIENVQSMLSTIAAVKGGKYAAAVEAAARTAQVTTIVENVAEHLGEHCANFDREHFMLIFRQEVNAICFTVLKLAGVEKDDTEMMDSLQRDTEAIVKASFVVERRE